ncbi:hypothetical protein T484DRAFT_1828845 [Baffinella frigidus]|nr:hypothetical protein T484DRAFT_1828845 [Cryptophyta sp. CCMP2293]
MLPHGTRKEHDKAVTSDSWLRPVQCAGQFRPQGVANLLWAFATAGVQPRADLLEAMYQRALATAGEFNQTDVKHVIG